MVRKEEAIANLNRNIDYIKSIKQLSSDSDLCRAADIAKGTLSSVRSGEKIPMIYPFFDKLCSYSGFTVDELLGTDLGEESLGNAAVPDEAKEMEYKACEGVYAGYYFNTSAIKGRERKDDDEALKYAVILVYREEDGHYACVGDFGLTREQQEERYNACFIQNGKGKPVKRPNFKSEFINRFIGDNLYDGTFTIHDNSIMLKMDSTKDSLTMMLNRLRNTPTNYVGGLAAAISVCTGVYPAPVMQLVGLSKGLLTESPAQIAARLYLSYPTIKCQEEDEKEIYEMIRYIIDGYDADKSGKLPGFTLTKDPEHAILIDAMNRAIDRTVKRNVGRTIQVTAIDEEDWFYMSKRFEEV